MRTRALQGDNCFVDADGLWFLGDFGSAVPVGEHIRSTTLWFAPLKPIIGTPATPQHDWCVCACGHALVG